MKPLKYPQGTRQGWLFLPNIGFLVPHQFDKTKKKSKLEEKGRYWKIRYKAVIVCRWYGKKPSLRKKYFPVFW